MNLEQIIGTKIRTNREGKNVKLESLARHLGISKARMSQIEHGECKELTLSRIQKIADYLGVNIFEILDAQLQKDAENPVIFNGRQNNITPELIRSLADELVLRMKS